MRKLMEYKIISGRTVEIRRCWMSTDREIRKTRGHRKAGNSSLKKIRQNEKDGIRRLARLLNCNFDAGDAFVTCKYDDRHLPIGEETDPDQKREEEYQAAKRIFTKKFLSKLRKEYRKASGKALAAVWVTANWSPKKDAPARLHHHLVIPRDAAELARQIWEAKYGGLGTFSLESLDGRGDHSDMAAYLWANVQGRPANENRFSACRGMKQPVVEEPQEVTDVEDVKPLKGSTVRDVEETRDEDGRVISKYMRVTLKRQPKIRRQTIVYER